MSLLPKWNWVNRRAATTSLFFFCCARACEDAGAAACPFFFFFALSLSLRFSFSPIFVILPEWTVRGRLAMKLLPKQKPNALLLPLLQPQHSKAEGGASRP